MPVTTVEMGNKWKIETAVTIKNIVMDVVRTAFGLKSTDRNIKVIRYDQDLFELKPPYEICITITMVTGYTAEFKQDLYTQLVSAINDKTLFKKEHILILLNEQPPQNWGIKGGYMADETLP